MSSCSLMILGVQSDRLNASSALGSYGTCTLLRVGRVGRCFVVVNSTILCR